MMKKQYPIEALRKYEVQALLDTCGQENWADRRS